MKVVTIFIVSLLCLGISAKTCREQVEELASSKPLLGAFKPVCQPNGLFAETQCHEGYCYCVVPETGEELLGTRVRFNKPKSCKLTPCLQQRSEGLLKSKQGMVGHFEPKCEEDGSFKKIQCHGSTGYCFCVVPETGKQILGTAVRGMPKSCDVKEKKCLEELNALQSKKLVLGAFKPVCQPNGLYADTQCHEGYCYCVIPETGVELLGTRVRFTKPKSCKATPCLLQRHEGKVKTTKKLVGHFTPQCEEDGSFKKVQCHGSTGFCFCVDSETGERIEGTEVRGLPTNCETAGINKAKKCLAELKGLEGKKQLLGAFKPVCQENGLYADTQCHEGYCYCVDPKTGIELSGTRLRFTKPKSCKPESCFVLRDHAMKDSARGMVGHFTPECETDGSFKKTQCHASTGFCFCVDSESGEKILGTELRFTKPKSCELTDCVYQRHEALKSNALGRFTPACDKDGLYAPMQCHEGFCYCVVPKTGQELLGTRLARGQKPVSCKVTKCVKERHEYLSVERPLYGAFKPECSSNGLYKPIQCHGSTCYCVFTESGEEVLGTMTRLSKPQSCELTECVLQRHKAWKMARFGLLGASISRCTPEGKFQKVQCRKGMCWCVNQDTGKPIEGTSAQWTVPRC